MVSAGVRTYEDAFVRVSLDRDWRVRESTVLAPWDGERSLRPAAEMAVLYDGISTTLPFLLVR